MEGPSCPAKQAKSGGPYNDGGKNRLGINSLSGVNHLAIVGRIHCGGGDTNGN